MEFKMNGNMGLLTVDGSLSINQSEEIRSVLLDAMMQADNVELRFGNVTDVDLTFLQLLCSANETYKRENKVFKVTGRIPECFNKAVEDAAFSYPIKKILANVNSAK